MGRLSKYKLQTHDRELPALQAITHFSTTRKKGKGWEHQAGTGRGDRGEYNDSSFQKKVQKMQPRTNCKRHNFKADENSSLFFLVHFCGLETRWMREEGHGGGDRHSASST